jgi:hypothetical protein
MEMAAVARVTMSPQDLSAFSPLRKREMKAPAAGMTIRSVRIGQPVDLRMR